MKTEFNTSQQFIDSAKHWLHKVKTEFKTSQQVIVPALHRLHKASHNWIQDKSTSYSSRITLITQFHTSPQPRSKNTCTHGTQHHKYLTVASRVPNHAPTQHPGRGKRPRCLEWMRLPNPPNAEPYIHWVWSPACLEYSELKPIGFRKMRSVLDCFVGVRKDSGLDWLKTNKARS